MSESHVLEALARVVVEDAQAACGRAADGARNEARALVLEAEDRVDALRSAARELGRTRGKAAEAAETRAGETEIAAVEAGAFDALFERFLRRVRMALQELPESGRYPAAIEAWAVGAAARIDGPVEVFAAKRDRPAVFEALLAAGAEDFHVRIDHRVHAGFVVRTLDGRTCFDARPDALLAGAHDELRALLEGSVPSPPQGLAEIRA